jgi:hypothetical protein
MGESFNGKRVEGGYECKICDFRCSYKSNYDIHISTRKHKTMVKHEGLLVEAATGHSTAQTAIPSNTCRYCNKRYAHLSALSRHKRTCPMTTATETATTTATATATETETETATTTQNITHDMYNKLIGLIEEVKNSNKNSDSNLATSNSDENIKVNVTDFQNTLVHTTNFMKEMMLMMTTQLHSKMMEISKHNNNDPAPATAPSSIGVATNGNHNTINSNNNTFNMNMFLNEQCKDAMNMKDFVNSIQLNLTDLENVGNLGYVKGMSNILIDNLQKMDVYKRPVHCSDVKRDTLYVKEDDEWERDGPDHPKMVNAVLAVEHKNVALVSEWAKANPRCMNSNTRENERYMKLSKAATDGEKEGNIAKVIKKVAKNVAIDKDTQHPADTA